MITFDTETCGFHGPIVLIQWAIDDGEIFLHNPWTSTIQSTIDLIEFMATHPGGVCGFNLAFDWFHICQMYTVLKLMPDPTAFLDDNIEMYAELEPLGRDGQCVKPVSACDVMLHARRGPYQSTMDRGDIRIKKVPTVLAWQLAEELDRRVKLKDIYFARAKKKKECKWVVYDIADEDEETGIDPSFKDIVLKFDASTALKALATDALGLKDDTVLLFTDVEINRKFYPEEIGYAPYARAIGDRFNWKGAWPEHIHHHINHWEYNSLAREYAEKDVEYTRGLWKHFGSPLPGDNDSELACMVGASRWRGYKVDVPKLKDLRNSLLKKASAAPTAPNAARKYLLPFLSDTEKAVIKGSTKKVLLEEMAKYKDICPDCLGENLECLKCKGCGEIPHPVAPKAQEVLDARQAGYKVKMIDKLILAGRFHASFNVIGALSGRMSGGGGDLNPQGIVADEATKECFLLAFEGHKLCGGDFDGFEVTLAEAVYKDPDLRKDLQTGKKIHALFGVFVYPHMTYEEILKNDDIYKRCKSAVFAMLYGGEGFTLKERLGVDIETADKAFDLFCRKYKQVGANRRRIEAMFCSMRQPGGTGRRVEWHQPHDKIESMFGFPRYFTLENQICKALYDLANDPPKDWKQFDKKVIRRDREQKAEGAVRSALFGAAFALQASNMRAANNHVIQSSGSEITKEVQRKIWDVQPSGVNDWVVQPFNVHDEIECPCKNEVVDRVKVVVNKTVESYRDRVPLIAMEWKTDMNSWADK